uniref:Uncharacterized protein n=1 Tax=Molossus molossus TaxID=27622 RepID=A0A7J8JVY1_MOLMO|nr:hypothetical protein HJG59_008013 [Molossus molossus]
MHRVLPEDVGDAAGSWDRSGEGINVSFLEEQEPIPQDNARAEGRGTEVRAVFPVRHPDHRLEGRLCAVVSKPPASALGSVACSAFLPSQRTGRSRGRWRAHPQVYPDLGMIQRSSAKCPECMTLSTLCTNERVSPETSISETKQRNLEKLAVQLLARHLSLITNMFVLGKHFRT